ncbi:transglycosylase domain-containing protein [Caulobacter sp. S45]|uniref:transglycosylase domain-containing protein n=1 Tax=Caulobacter sp. S45 TaxID=1641861 RepID=UPI00131BA0F4|nr:PBP1A family penicillin-binding protein [Caulobacter sp. S45]
MANADHATGRPGGGSGGRPPRGGRRRRSLLGSIIYWLVVLAVWVLIAIAAMVLYFSRGLPDTSKLYQIHRQPSISYLDRNGALLSVRGSQYAPPVDLDALPAYVPAAFVSVEDRRFYQHWGFDIVGIMRAVVADLRRGHAAEGASTITQQLARNLFLTPDQNMKRKVQELLLAVWLEHQYSKKQILALYLNRVYFGAGAYGVESASETFFNKPASKIDIGEAALLAALLKSPTHYSPVNEQERAGRRATIVLDKMVETHAITPAQREEALSHPVRVSPALATQHAQYFVDWVDGQVRKLVGQPTTDLIVETTLDLPIDTAAETAARTVVERNGRLGVQQAAVVALDGGGRVRALIGGVSYADSQFDRAIDARRQAGSSWKPFVYLTALNTGRYNPDTQVVDEPVTINGWSPHNFEPENLGPLPLHEALQRSINTVAAKLADDVGRNNVADTARKLGITTDINTDPAMALGTSLVSPLEMAQAYDAFANGGFKVQAYAIERIRTRDGKVLYEHPAPAHDSVIGEPQLGWMNQMLRTVLVSPGTAPRAAIPGYDLAGKTGTTSDFRDAWFVGYTGGFVAAVWTGKDDNSPMHHVTGGAAPAELWRAFMTAALPRLKVQAIPGGAAGPAPLTDDPIGELLGNTTGLSQGAPDATDGDAQDQDGQPPPPPIGPPPGPPPGPRPPPPAPY